MTIRDGRRYYFLFQLWFLFVHWVVFFLFSLFPRFRIEVWLINLYIRRQGRNLVRFGSKYISGAIVYIYGALMGGWAVCWVGGEEISGPFLFVTFGLLRAWHACAGTLPPRSARVGLIGNRKII